MGDFASSCITGFALIINNKYFVKSEEREGSERDVENLRKCLSRLNFQMDIYSNCNSIQMNHLMMDYASKDYSRFDCFMCVIMTHGDVDHVIYGTDDAANKLHNLISPFKDSRSLRGKPKMFVIQSCRGTKDETRLSERNYPGGHARDMSSENLYRSPSIDIGSMMFKKIPLEADILIYYSTVDGFVSWRDPTDGSWFIDSLCHVFNKYALLPNVELNTLLLRVNNRVAGKFNQMPEIVSRLRKEFYFNYKPELANTHIDDSPLTSSSPPALQYSLPSSHSGNTSMLSSDAQHHSNQLVTPSYWSSQV